MPPHPAAELLAKRWDLLAEYKDQSRRERKRLGAQEALRVVDALRAHVRLFNPTWPTREDRQADLEAHIRVSAALARTAPGEAGRRIKATQTAQRPAGLGRGPRRIRKGR
jgi:hypothetical protein